ncbi:hypothetical protein GCM10027515_29620 [Schumannella luteola]|uniref:ATPase AAA-type core domain-containing protein n=1 Tax=Schumannella luteola TaxID=472059 RepID=A0A852YHB3_9MICO|nr:hypothetical protein [Schumannella luteola]TPX05621.1 AAA family ATPase [Schumannella luteola]
MRVIRIQFRGYQRLVNTACNTDGKLIAFLGPNEAGKTTVLRALEWFSSGAAPLPPTSRNRLNPPEGTSPVVEVTYWLAAEDVAALAHIGRIGDPSTFTRTRDSDGTWRSSINPEVHRVSTPFEEARASFAAALEAPEGHFTDRDDESIDYAVQIDEAEPLVSEVLSNVDAGWNPEWTADWDNFMAVLAQTDAGKAIAAQLGQARQLLEATHPNDAIQDVLRQRAPGFVMFTEADRNLQSSYNLADEALRAAPPSALANLAWVAGLDLSELWAATSEGDVRTARTLERRANERLRATLGPRWSQKGIDVEFNLSGSELEVLVVEHAPDGSNTPVRERSDGLLTFIALVAFLARQDFPVPPVLLVDEAETHLHYDAQADLVEVLTNDVAASQVFYTTHSPGCLPRDLGTGVRLVAPDAKRSDMSTLRNDFWTADARGFTPLLFAMGAGAAAFSSFRKAVLAEGPADMILLPSLLRLATGLHELDFQVVPGIAESRADGLELEDAAARVVWLLDGDDGGDIRRTQLLESGVREDRIFQYAAPKAVEDFVDRAIYVDMVNALLATKKGAPQITASDLATGVSVAKAVEMWGLEAGAKVPGKTVVASQLISDAKRLVLADGAADELNALHNAMISTLGKR